MHHWPLLELSDVFLLEALKDLRLEDSFQSL